LKEQIKNNERPVRDPGRKWFILLLLACLAVLSRYILFKHQIRYYRHHLLTDFKKYTLREGLASANFRPFYNIRLFSSNLVSEQFYVVNIWGNILGFVPIGFLIPLAFPNFRNFFSVTFLVFLLSLGYETTQLIFGLGIFDVDDLILNTTGGFAGYLIFAVARLIFKPRGELTQG
jgi:glycopeptide antibiotics resistance protein